MKAIQDAITAGTIPSKTDGQILVEVTRSTNHAHIAGVGRNLAGTSNLDSRRSQPDPSCCTWEQLEDLKRQHALQKEKKRKSFESQQNALNFSLNFFNGQQGTLSKFQNPHLYTPQVFLVLSLLPVALALLLPPLVLLLSALIVAAIEQFTDLEETNLDEAIGRMKAFEERVNLFNGSPSDKQDKLLFSNHDNSSSHKKGFKNGGQEKFRSYQDNKQDGKTKQFNNEKKPSHKFKRNTFQKGTKDSSKVKCYNCNKFGHVRRNCKLKDNGEEQSNLVQEDVEPTLLMEVQEKRDKGKKIFLNEKEIKPKNYISTDESLCRALFPNQTNTKSSEPLKLVCGDLCGPISPKIESGKKYRFLLVDDCTRYMLVYFLKSKNEAFETFKEFKLKVKNEVGKKLKSFRTDRGGEFTSREFTRYCKENGILRQLTAPYSQQQNGIVERRNRDFIISENQTSSSRITSEVSTQDSERNDEDSAQSPVQNNTHDDEIEQPIDNPSTPPPYTCEPNSEDSTGYTSSIASSSRPFDHTPVRGYRNLSKIYNRAPEVQSDELLLLEEEPRNYKEAAQDKKWIEAMQIEINSININKTWKLATLPDNQKAIGLKWVFKTKRDGNGKIIKHKARLVAKGYVQEHVIDYDEVFAPVARMETVRLILALSAYHGWEVHQLDVKSAFLHSELKEEVYVTQPEGFKKPGNENKVYRLVKALYGLKQAPCAWNMKLNQTLKSLNFRKCTIEQAIYTRVRKDSMLLVGVYVDDLIVTRSSNEDLQKFKS
nr:ribonuclease H-like domain, reverse transcriptase, RNA-dependent DNA polymerase [Tanacetum cinerariifolium]